MYYLFFKTSCMNTLQIAKMAESNQYSESPLTSKVGPALLKKKMNPVSKICAKSWVEQFPNNFYAEENILFWKFYLHTVDIIRVDNQRSYKIKKVFSAGTEGNYNFVEI